MVMQRRPSASTARLVRFRVAVLVQIRDCHVGAFAGVENGNRAADA
jgi:hypothetical protein